MDNFKQPTTGDIIDYLQEKKLWVDPDADMDPKELDEFCESLIITQEVDIVDVAEWVALRNAQDVTDKVEETEIEEETTESTLLSSLKNMRRDVKEEVQDELAEEISAIKKKNYEYVDGKAGYSKILKFVNTTADNFIQDISNELHDHDGNSLRSVRIAVPMYIGPKTMSRLIEMLMEEFGNRVMFEVIPKPTNQFTDIYIRPNSNLEAITNLEISVSIELD